MATNKARRAAASILLLTALAAQPVSSFGAPATQAPAAHYRAFDSRGRAVALSDIVEAAGAADVLVIGETHNDAVAHLLEAELLRLAEERFGQSAHRPARRVALSLEMFERDVQAVLDEYLAGLVSERHFVAASRPWRNYATDYRPLVEYARERRLHVIAANAPARYVSRVNGFGPDSLRALSNAAKAWLPPLPYAPASEAYAAKFRRFMQGEASAAHPATPPAANPSAPSPHARTATPNPHGAHGASFLLDAQTLRDAAMAHAVAEHLKSNSGALVVHVNGTFHSEERLGVPEHVKLYRPGARVLVVTIVTGEGFPSFDAARLGRLGDFVILTDPAVPRSS